MPRQPAKHKSEVRSQKSEVRPPTSDLFPSPSPSAPAHFTLGPQTTWKELHPFTSHDGQALRRRETEINPATGAPWIPKAVLEKRLTAPTLAGICAYKDFQLTRLRGLPEEFATIADMEAQTPFPREMIQYALKHGCQMRHPSGRQQLKPFLDFFRPIFTKMFSGGVLHVKGLHLEGFDSDLELARLRREQANDAARANALANGSLHTETGLKDTLWEEGLKAIADDWKRYDKSTGVKLRKLLLAAGLPAGKVTEAVALALAGVAEPVRKLRDLLPEKFSANGHLEK